MALRRSGAAGDVPCARRRTAEWRPVPGRLQASQERTGGGALSAELCAAFLLGYLAAVERFYLGVGGDGGYHDRATETRAKGLLYREKRLKGTRYCVPGDESLDAIIERINEQKLDGDEPRFADNVVQAVLDRHYLCPE